MRNLPKIDKGGKKKSKEKETGRVLENRLQVMIMLMMMIIVMMMMMMMMTQEEREERSNGSRKSAGSSNKDLATVSEEEHD